MTPNGHVQRTQPLLQLNEEGCYVPLHQNCVRPAWA
jgi:hypothetical protein